MILNDDDCESPLTGILNAVADGFAEQEFRANERRLGEFRRLIAHETLCGVINDAEWLRTGETPEPTMEFLSVNTVTLK